MDGSLFVALKTRLAWGMIGLAAGLGASGYYLYKGDEILSINIAIISLFVPIFLRHRSLHLFFTRQKIIWSLRHLQFHLSGYTHSNPGWHIIDHRQYFFYVA